MAVTLRKVKKTDWDFILKLRNSKKFRSYFYDQHTIKKKEHYEYLEEQKLNPNFFNWIICFENHDVGYARILDGDISIMIKEKFQGKGIGTKSIKLIEKEARSLGIKKLIGKMMVENKGSEYIFKKNGFELKMLWYEKDL